MQIVNKNRFLFELGLEEIPAAMISPALEQMSQSFEARLREDKLEWEKLRPFSSPRRLALIAEGLPDRQPDREEVVLGPPKKVAFDDRNQPTAAAQGFARKQAVSLDELQTVDTERGAYLACRKQIPGRPLVAILPQVLPQVVGSIAWPRNMYWQESGFRFIRPLRWCVALWNGEVLPFEFEGLKAGNITYGHRFLGQRELILSDADEYVDKLRENFVLVDLKERQGKIAKELERQTPEDLHILSDRKLGEMVLHLNEYPSVICGSFAEEFLELPKEVLVTVMRYHQKYFSLVNDAGEIQPYFLTVLNTDGDPGGEIRKGHETVLRARLEDAFFFWEADRKVSLEDRVKELDEILFQEKLGTYQDKTERVRKVCASLGDDPHLDLAARLCKADLSTEMVREFPELQGVMGGLYAGEEGYPEAVCKAIYEHYRPVSRDDHSPSSRLGALLSLADKLDTIAGCFSIDIIPTGSSDPFALRRQAQGIVKVLFDHHLEYSVSGLVASALKNFPEDEAKKVRGSATDFIHARVRRILEDAGIAYDVLNAVMAVGIKSVHDTYERGQSLAGIKGEEDFEALAVSYKRIKNILSEQTIDLPAVSEKDLEEAEEQDLHRAFLDIQPTVEASLAERDYTAALKQMAALRQTVDRFFDEVLVMAEDPRLRGNRLRLLHDISQLFLQVADISEIVQEGESNK